MKKIGDISSYVDDDAFAQEALKGTQVLLKKDEQVTRDANISKKVIAYSLFGAEPGYCEGTIINAQIFSSIYPAWEIWVFYDDSVPKHVITRLHQLGVATWHVARLGIAHWPGTFWRFYAVCMAHVEYVIFRDVDSVLGQREKGLVDVWLASGKPFHVIRDWYSHQDLILAGLWGAYAPLLEKIDDWIEAYITSQKLHPTHADQEFLAASVWPRIKAFMLEHDSIHQGRNIVTFDPPTHINTGQEALGGYRYKRLELDISQAVNLLYALVLLDEKQQEIFRYEREFIQGKDSVQLPYEYTDKIDAGLWRLEALPKN